MTEFTIEGLILSAGYAAVFACMFANGASGFPSSPFVYVTAGLLVGAEKIDGMAVVLFGTLGNVLGNIILYEAARRKGLQWILKKGGYFQKYIPIIEKIQRVFELRGLRIVLIGKFIPMVKVVIPVVSGMAEMNRVLFASAVAVTCFVWAVVSVGYGYYFAWMAQSGDVTWWFVGISLLSVPVVIWWFFKHVNTFETAE